MQEIVVTANKREESLNTVPMSVAAVSGLQLAIAGVSTAADLAKVVPSFTVSTSFNGVPIYNLRGVGYSDFTAGATPTVSVYNDEANLPFTSMADGPLFDLERVEVLKGPQGTLFGLNSTGGAINFIAAKPQAKFASAVTVSYSRFDTANLEGYVTGPLSDTVAVRLSATLTRSGPWQYSTTGNESMGDKDTSGARLQLSWKPTSDLTVLVSPTAWHDASDPQMPQFYELSLQSPLPQSPLTSALINSENAYQSLFGGGRGPQNDRAADWDSPVANGFAVPGQTRYYRDDTGTQIAPRIDWRLGPSTTLTSLSNYALTRLEEYRDVDGTDLLFQDALIRANLSTVGEELRLSQTLNGLRLLVGGNYQLDHANEFNTIALEDASIALDTFPLGGPFSAVTQSGNQSYRTLAGFANGEYAASDTVIFTLGARFTDVHHQLIDACLADAGYGNAYIPFGTLGGLLASDGDPLSPAFAAAKATYGPGKCVTADVVDPARLGFSTATTDSYSEDNVAWKGGVSWEPAQGSLFYANATRGFKAGGYLTGAIPVNSVYLTHVRQEELTSYELGLKQSLLNRSLQLNASAFYYDYDNKQINADVPAVIFGQVERLLNIPKSRVFGIDGDLTFRPVSRLTLRSAFTYLDTRITQVDPGAFTLTDYRNNAFPDTAIVGARFPYAPQWNVTAGGDYDWYTTDSWSAFAGADLLWNSRTSSSLLTRVTNCVDCTLATIRAFTTLDLRAGLRSADDKWSFYMWGRNVTDKYYWTATAHISDTVVRYTGQPATYGATLRYSF